MPATLRAVYGQSVVLPNLQRDDCGVCVGTSDKSDARWNAALECVPVCHLCRFFCFCRC